MTNTRMTAERRRRRRLGARRVLWTAPGGATGAAAFQARAPFQLRAKDHIAIIGNTLAERMQYDGWLETMLHARFPKHELVIRNLGFSGDEVTTRLRSKNFGTPDEWLSGHARADRRLRRRIGSTAPTRRPTSSSRSSATTSRTPGRKGSSAFKKQLGDWITHTLAQRYNGKTAPRIVLFSPIAHEDLGNPDLPDGEENNQRLELYTRAMAEVAKAHRRDVRRPVRAERASSTRRTAAADDPGRPPEQRRQPAHRQVIDRALFGAPPAHRQALPRTSCGRRSSTRTCTGSTAIASTDGYSTYGDRAFLTFVRGNPRNVNAEQAAKAGKEDVLPSNYDVLQREISDPRRDDRQPRSADLGRRARRIRRTRNVKVDDSDTPPFIDAQTNEPGKGPDGAHSSSTARRPIQKMTIGQGLKVELFASEKEFPELVNPVQMAFDTKGRLWVAAWKNYPHWQPKTPMDDKLLILEDTNGDGKADKRTVFAGDLNNPTGFEFYNGGVIVAQQPNLVFLKDTNGDDRYDTKEILLHGFDSADTHHAINSFTFDPGGALYMQEGIFHRTQVESPWGPTMRQADGGVYRFEPRTWKIETYIPMNFPNPHGHVFDHWGRNIVFDATGGQPFYGPSFSTKKYYPAMETNKAPQAGQRARAAGRRRGDPVEPPLSRGRCRAT